MTVSILAVRLSGHRAARDDLSLEELIYQTTHGLLDDVGISINDIDHLAIASSDGLDGRAISSMVTMSSAGGYFRDQINCSSSGEHALVMAALHVLSERSRLALVVNWGKPSETPLPVVDNLGFDPFFYRDLRVERTSLLALQANAYAARTQLEEDLPRRLAMAARAEARKNPLALPDGAPNGIEARSIAWPLTADELPPYADGAVALLIGNEEAARSLGRPSVVISGMGWATDSYWSGSRDLTWLSSLDQAARQAYGRAHIQDPLSQLDVAEIMDVTPYHELMTYEALGLAARGEGARLAEQRLAGRPPLAINPSGGLYGGYVDFAAGVERVAEVYLQLVGAAGDHQVDGAQRGLAQATAGFAGQSNSVFVLEGRGA